MFDSTGDGVRTAAWTVYVDANNEVRTAGGFQVVTPAAGGAYTSGEFVLMNPVSISRYNLDGQITDSIEVESGTATTLPNSTLADLDGTTFATSTAADPWSRWTHHVYYNSGLASMDLAYTDIADGVYLLTQYVYDDMGRSDGTMEPTGTIDRETYDARGLVTSESIGTADGAVWPGTGVSPSSNMARTATYQYDGGTGGGDGLLTGMTQVLYPSSTSTDRVTLYGYDWRDRQLWTMVDDHTPDPNNPGYTRKTYTYNTYDNLDDVTNVTRYYDLANTQGLPTGGPNAGDPIIGESGAAYDNLGRQYQSIAYNQNGSVAIVSNTWFDGDGDAIMTLPGGTQEFTKTVYDGLGDPTAVYDGYDPTNSAVTYAAAGSVSGDVILSQTNSQYDPAGDETFDTAYDRLPTAPATDTGGLDATANSGQSRVSYTASWYDALGRQTVEADYGTNNDTAMTLANRPDQAPVWNWDGVNATWQDPSGTAVGALVTGTGYNARGEDYSSLDTAGIETRTTFDDDARTTSVVQNYSGDGNLVPGSGDQNLNTETFYSLETPVASTDVLEPNTKDQTVSFSPVSFVPGGPAGGDIFLMYAPNATDMPLDVTDRSCQVFCVTYTSKGWQYCYENSQDVTVVQNSVWKPFTPRADDILLARCTARRAAASWASRARTTACNTASPPARSRSPSCPARTPPWRATAWAAGRSRPTPWPR